MPARADLLLPLTRHVAGFESPMSASEAIKILGVQSKSDKAAILAAHRSLMRSSPPAFVAASHPADAQSRQNHPDLGGSPYLASKVRVASRC
jgi:hypothetical protein